MFPAPLLFTSRVNENICDSLGMRLNSSEGRETSKSRNRTHDQSSDLRLVEGTSGSSAPPLFGGNFTWEALRSAGPSTGIHHRFSLQLAVSCFSAVNLKCRCLKEMSTLELTRASAQHPRDPIRERLHFQSFRPGALHKWEDD